jgi:hypothetical protein
MCSHLTARIPGNLHIGLHQDFWRHRRSCARCDGRHSKGSYEYENTVCCLEHLIKTRNIVKRRGKVVEADEPSNSEIDQPQPARKQVKKKELTPEQIQANHEKKLAAGFIAREYMIDDDFNADASGQTGKKRIAYFRDYQAKRYDVKVELDIGNPMGDGDSSIDKIEISLKL